MQRAIDAGLGLVIAVHRLVEIVEDAGDLARVAPDQTLAQAIDGALHGFMRRAVMVHGRGVPVADGAVLAPNADDPALGRRVRSERELPVLVLFRQNRFINPDVDDLHGVCLPVSRCYSAAVAAARCCGSRNPARSMRGSNPSLMCGKSLT